MQYLKQSTQIKVRVGPAMDPTDGVTPVTSLTLAAADQAELLKNNGAATVDISGRTFAAVTGCDGWYDLTLTTTDTNTLGMATVVLQDASATLPMFLDFEVLPSNVFDSMILDTDKLQTDGVELAGTTVTGFAQYKADVSGLSTFDPSATPVEIRATGGTAGKNAEALVDDVWDEPLTAATHNVATSSGRRLRNTDPTIIEGTAQGAGANGNQIILEGTSSAVDGAYDPAGIWLTTGTGAGQCRNILEYEGSTKTATVDRTWKVNPDGTTGYRVIFDPGREHVNEGLAQAGTSTSITLNTSASSADDAYCDQQIFIRSGLGEDQVRIVTDYDGTTKIATVDKAWDTTPDATSAYVMLPNIGSRASQSFSVDTVIEDTTSEGGRTFSVEEAFRIFLAVMAGYTTGGASNPKTFAAAGGDGTTVRVSGSKNAVGNSTTVITFDTSDI